MSASSLPLLGPCQVWWGTAGAETELGKTHGGVTFRCTEEAVDIFFDQFGTTPYDSYTVGKPTEVECNFANLSYTLLANILPTEATLYGGDPTPTPYVGDDAIDIWLGLGTSHRANAKRLILIPYVDGIPSANVEDRIYIPLAFPRINLEWMFDAETQRVVNCIFKAFPVSQATPRIWFMGDESLLP
jgi:hypothetical protein